MVISMDLRIKKTHKLLMESLIKLLEEKPINEIKLTEICDLAMVHKTTFYNHFKDKYDLLKYTILNIQKEMLSKLPTTNNIIDYYTELAKLYMQNIKQHKNLYQQLLTNDVDNLCTNIFIEMFIKDVEKNINDSPIPTNYLANFYVYGVFAIINEWFKRGMKESENEIISYLKKIIIYNPN